MKTIKIFLASSEELKPERLELTDMVAHLNHTLKNREIEVELVKWEHLDSSMSPVHKQEEYNNELRDCDLCIVLYWTRFGMYTKTELDIAYHELCAGNNPKKIYVYFKDADDVSPDLQEFKDSFPTYYGHFFCSFANADTLKADFLLQFIEYLSKTEGSKNLVEIRNSQVIVGDKVYVNLTQVPFAGNNDEYNLLLKNIQKTKKLLAVTDTDDPEFTEYATELQDLMKKQQAMEDGLWDIALLITKLCTNKCSERQQRAISLFNKGDADAAQAILNEEEIEKDVNHNLQLIKLGEEGKKGLITNIDEYRLKIKMLHCSQNREDYESIVTLRRKVLDLCVFLYGEYSTEVAEEFHELAKEYELLDNYAESQTNYEKSIDIHKKLGLDDTLSYADLLRGFGRLHVTNDMFLKGKPYLEQALAIVGEKFGVNNLTYVKTLRDMSLFYRNMDLFDEAIESASNALDILIALPDFDKSLYNSIKRTLAITYSISDKHNYFTTTKDKNDSDKAIIILKEVYESEIADKRASINNLYLIGKVLRRGSGWPLKENPKLIEAAKCFTKALAIAREIDDKKAIHTLLENIGSVYKYLGTPEKAEALGYSYPIQKAADSKTLCEAYRDQRKEKEQRDLEMARKIANLYLERFPRKLSFGVTLTSSEDDSEMTIYHVLSEEEIEILQGCSTIAFEEKCTLDEILSGEGHEELVEKLLEHYTPMQLNIVDSVDLDNPQKFTSFHFQSIKEDGTFGYKQIIGIALTDDEFKDILIELLLFKNRYSMNMLVYHKPDLCQKIIKHITYASMDYQFENWNTYFADMCEHKDICEKILNPFKDILNIFNSEDKDIAEFALCHQIVPDGGEVYTSNDLDWFQVLMGFHGKDLYITQEGLTNISATFHDYDCFRIDAIKVMGKFGIDKPEDILPYLKEHYNTPDCFYRIKKEFEA